MRIMLFFGLLASYSILCFTSLASNASPLNLNVATGTLETKRNVDFPIRDISVNENGAQVSYCFENAMLFKQSNNQITRQYSLEFPGFRRAVGNGLPMIPMRADMFVMAASSSVNIVIEESNYVDYKMELAPSIPSVTDHVDSQSVKVQEIFDYDGFYPNAPVMETGSSLLHNLNLVSVQVSPVQYDKKNKIVRIYSKLVYRLEVLNHDECYQSIGQRELEEILNLQRSGVICLIDVAGKSDEIFYSLTNSNNISQEYCHDGFIRTNDTYLIVCGSKVKNAADKLAEWKKITGYNAIVISSILWRQSARALQIRNYYSNCQGKMYCLFLGDKNTIPTYEKVGFYHYFTDCPYFCINGEDAVPEVRYARIPCSNLAEAEIAVRKIINYEKTPPTSNLFYKSGINVAMFQDYIDAETQNSSSYNPDGYEDRRFTETSYEIAQYLRQYEFMKIYEYYRLYRPVIDDSHFVWHWSKIDSYGDVVPGNVPITCEHYDFNKNKFSQWFNNGALYLFYRGHASSEIWGNVEIDVSTFQNASNGEYLPYCFNLCCDTGKDMGNTFPKSMLFNPNGGAIGCFASTDASISVANNGLAHGIFNAFWPSPGIVSDFVYTPLPYCPEVPCYVFIPDMHDRTYEVFEAVQQGFLRTEQIFPTLITDNRYQREVYSLFGDPAQILYTTNPYSIRSQTSFTVERNNGKVSVEYPYQKGVITIYDKLLDTVKCFIGASRVTYNCADSESVVVSVKCGAALTQISAGRNVNL